AHVKFIFATTEIRKVPVTVLSRCQRFDLRRIEPEVMMAHLAGIAAKEGARVAADALALITRAAEGSVRDALSLLDQAVAHGREAETGAADVRRMLGLADRGRVFDLFEAIMRGDAGAALAELGAQYAEGADPGVVLRDLAELTHWISVVKIAEAAAEDPTVSPDERRRGRDLAGRLSMRVLTRAWQMLLKALEELAVAPSAMMAAEMAVIRLTHVADLPTPGDLVRRLTEAGGAEMGAAVPAGGGSSGGSGGTGGGGNGGTRAEAPPLRAVAGGRGPAPATTRIAQAPMAQAGPVAQAEPVAIPIEDIAAIVAGARDIKLLDEVERYLSPVTLRPGLIEFTPRPGAPADLAGRLAQTLGRLSGRRWSVAVSDAGGGPTLAETRAETAAGLIAEAARHPLVIAALKAFPGAKIGAMRPLGDLAPGAEADYLAAMPEDATVEIDGDILDADDPFGEES
ncbi:MAG: DNA polymerase III subunit gamma/tau, partial [Thermohalobaculum sp.]|nr:DNA polymerase III subunit gamma/tau [Thermohalobaculum sp.]